jgi:hypothetical protein
VLDSVIFQYDPHRYHEHPVFETKEMDWKCKHVNDFKDFDTSLRFTQVVLREAINTTLLLELQLVVPQVCP